jgi:toxin ParE1/3/4
MAEVIWSPNAVDDLDAIGEYIARDSVDAACVFVSRLIDAVEHLQQFPRSGRVIPEVGDENCREVVYGAYRLMYRLEGEDVWITGVVHAARKWKPD